VLHYLVHSTHICALLMRALLSPHTLQRLHYNTNTIGTTRRHSRPPARTQQRCRQCGPRLPPSPRSRSGSRRAPIPNFKLMLSLYQATSPL
jgi:hypothetical protein